MVRIKKCVVLGLFIMCMWVGMRSAYTYLFDHSEPVITVQGINDGAWYAGDREVSVQADKSTYLSVWLDDAPLIHDLAVSKNKPRTFTVATKDMQTGEHVLKIVCKDRSLRQNSTTSVCTFGVDNKPLQVASMQETFSILQGRTLHVKFQTNKDVESACVKFLAHTYPCFKEHPASTLYECFIPISCEEKAQEYPLLVEVQDKPGNKIKLDNRCKVIGCEFKKQIITVDAQKVQEEKAKGRALAELEKQLSLLAGKSPQEKLWRGAFCTPIDIERVTCEFGTIRTTQERGRYAHNALDVINKPKSVVWSTQDGIVVLKDRFDYSGNTVVVDHGQGILSLFYHLDDFSAIEVGQKIVKGNPIGTLGKTGYATGYHLHWEMRVNNIPVDPMQWTQETF